MAKKHASAKRSARATIVNKGRGAEQKKMLEDRRRELVGDINVHMRDMRTEEREPLDRNPGGSNVDVDAAIQEDIELTLIQMKAETLNKIDAALRRLEEGSYGICGNCAGEIAEARLRALLFAVRCKNCEDAREEAEKRQRAASARYGTETLFDPA